MKYFAILSMLFSLGTQAAGLPSEQELLSRLPAAIPEAAQCMDLSGEYVDVDGVGTTITQNGCKSVTFTRDGSTDTYEIGSKCDAYDDVMTCRLVNLDANGLAEYFVDTNEDFWAQGEVFRINFYARVLEPSKNIEFREELPGEPADIYTMERVK